MVNLERLRDQEEKVACSPSWQRLRTGIASAAGRHFQDQSSIYLTAAMEGARRAVWWPWVTHQRVSDPTPPPTAG